MSAHKKMITKLTTIKIGHSFHLNKATRRHAINSEEKAKQELFNFPQFFSSLLWFDFKFK